MRQACVQAAYDVREPIWRRFHASVYSPEVGSSELKTGCVRIMSTYRRLPHSRLYLV